MNWTEENSEEAEKSLWAKRYYDFLYLLLFLPGVIIASIIASIRGDCDNTSTQQNILVLIIINMAISTFDKAFNFGKIAGDFGQYSGMYQGFSDKILEELVKPDGQKRNGSQFFHDMNIEKQRLGDKTAPVPWVVDKLYQKHKLKNVAIDREIPTTITLSSNSSVNSVDLNSADYDQPNKRPSLIRRQVSDPENDQTKISISYEASPASIIPQNSNRKEENAARIIQKYYLKYLINKYIKNSIEIPKSLNLKYKKLINGNMMHIITEQLLQPYDNRSTRSSSPKQITPPKIVKTRPLSQLRNNQSLCNIRIDHPKTKMQKKLAKMLAEQDFENPLKLQITPDNVKNDHRRYELNRFEHHFTQVSQNDNIIQDLALSKVI
jgi:hypothetical protein